MLLQRYQGGTHGPGDIRAGGIKSGFTVDLAAGKIVAHHHPLQTVRRNPQQRFRLQPGADQAHRVTEIKCPAVVKLDSAAEFRVADNMHAAHRTAVFITDLHAAFGVQAEAAGGRAAAFGPGNAGAQGSRWSGPECGGHQKLDKAAPVCSGAGAGSENVGRHFFNLSCRRVYDHHYNKALGLKRVGWTASQPCCNVLTFRQKENERPMTDLYAMAMLGLLGTGHCLGMCGPLVFALPGQSGRFAAHVYYHAGRVGAYTLVGAVMGAIGWGLAGAAALWGGDPLQWIARLQVFFSFVAAGFLLFLGLARLEFVREPLWMSVAAPDKLPGFARALRGVTGDPKTAAFLPVGFFLGFLPCGLSFSAFARSLAARGPVDGGLLALAFGCGTLPGLLVFGAGAHRLMRRLRRYSDPLSGMFMVGMAMALAAEAAGALL